MSLISEVEQMFPGFIRPAARLDNMVHLYAGQFSEFKWWSVFINEDFYEIWKDEVKKRSDIILTPLACKCYHGKVHYHGLMKSKLKNAPINLRKQISRAGLVKRGSQRYKCREIKDLPHFINSIYYMQNRAPRKAIIGKGRTFVGYEYYQHTEHTYPFTIGGWQEQQLEALWMMQEYNVLVDYCKTVKKLKNK